MRIPLFISFFLFSALVSAGLYKWVDSDGMVHYSDRPVEHAEELGFPETGAPPGAPDSESTQESGGTVQEIQQTGEYTQFELLEPEQNQTLRNDEGKVLVGMLLQPGLLEGHKISVSVDGTPLKHQHVSTQLVLRDVPRGTHSLQATVIDEQGQPLISTPAVSFHMRKAPIVKADP